MTNVSRLGLASVILLLAGCTTQSSTPVTPPPAAPAPAAPAPAAPAPVAPAPAAPAPAAAAPGPVQMIGGLPDGPNREFVAQVCSSCHDASSFSGQRHSRAEWQGVVASMNTGVSNADEARIVDYLATYLAPGR